MGVWDWMSRVAGLAWRGREVVLVEEEVASLRGALTSEREALEVSRAALEEAMVALRAVGGADLVAAWQQGHPVYPLWASQKRVVPDALKRAFWVYVCVMTLAEAASSVPWYVYRSSKGGVEKVPSHPLQKLLDRPNPQWSWRTCVRLIVTHQTLSGEAYLGKTYAGFRLPQELWPMNPAFVTPVCADSEEDSGSILKGYQYTINGGVKNLDPRDLIPWITPDPERPLRGLSPLQVGAGVVNVDAKSLDWQAEALDNTVLPSGVLSDPKTWSAEQFVNEKSKMSAAHVGSGNRRKLLYLDGGKTYTPLTMTAVELDLLKSRGFNRDQILALYKVPGPVVGVYDNATYNNVRTAYEQFWRGGVLPILDDLAAALNQHLTPDFGEGIWIGYDTSRIKPLRHVDEATARTALILRQCGVPMSVVSDRLELDLPAYDGWDAAGPPTTTPQTPAPMEPETKGSPSLRIA